MAGCPIKPRQEGSVPMTRTVFCPNRKQLTEFCNKLVLLGVPYECDTSLLEVKVHDLPEILGDKCPHVAGKKEVDHGGFDGC